MKVMHDAQYCNLSCDVPHDGQKSDHFPLQLDLACTISMNSTNARSSSSQPSTCLQFRYVDSQADAYQQCLTAELLMHLVPLLTGTVDVDTVVAILIACMTEAAQQTLQDRQAELDRAYQRITAAEAASHEGKNKAQVNLQLFLKIDIFHSVWVCLSFNGFQLQMSLDPFSRDLDACHGLHVTCTCLLNWLASAYH